MKREKFLVEVEIEYNEDELNKDTWVQYEREKSNLDVLGLIKQQVVHVITNDEFLNGFAEFKVEHEDEMGESGETQLFARVVEDDK